MPEPPRKPSLSILQRQSSLKSSMSQATLGKRQPSLTRMKTNIIGQAFHSPGASASIARRQRISSLVKNGELQTAEFEAVYSELSKQLEAMVDERRAQLDSLTHDVEVACKDLLQSREQNDALNTQLTELDAKLGEERARWKQIAMGAMLGSEIENDETASLYSIRS
ncbi:hypothetical protein J8273_2162 [Carpediemonas membranifera]|uniref:Uncharacterized protein n=1 Tax=Carpediemonas membranifera TaxID=201153 RepID=A0A8J6E447_9EUKA|nr:hypothetical protein J8273_2162 [Carpediemonas membranifera]|eukprot:KAG9396431.1 hypothetical protein J8273_2162 [Carpediemonas membranifera]